MQKPRTLAPGVQYFRDPESKNRRLTRHRFYETFEAWGYQELVLPIIDYAQSFYLSLGAGVEERMYSFVDRDGSLLALRPDITTLVAKVVAADGTTELPLRVWYDGQVFRYENPKAGQQREFYQVGIELIGSRSAAAEIEVLLVLLEGLVRSGLKSAIIPLGHAEFFNGIAESLNLSEEDAAVLKNLVDHKDSWGIGQLISRLDVPQAKQDFLKALPRLAGRREVLARAEQVVQNPRSRRALEQLAHTFDELSSLGVGEHFLIDLADVRSLDYYTGLIFRVYSESLGFEIGGGGRYDSLIGKFGRSLPAVGFSIGLERLLAALEPEGPSPSEWVSTVDFGTALRQRKENKRIRMELPL
ncbi:MAG TPA: ATP phosphoribosyltransferase regulatory subunit [Acidobacteriota bacterium]|nr:ATP phosphoribosyltransferase regulatory subunit [Acidobacteriota bacterium]